jgi:hypothetical protein
MDAMNFACVAWRTRSRMRLGGRKNTAHASANDGVGGGVGGGVNDRMHEGRHATIVVAERVSRNGPSPAPTRFAQDEGDEEYVTQVPRTPQSRTSKPRTDESTNRTPASHTDSVHVGSNDHDTKHDTKHDMKVDPRARGQHVHRATHRKRALPHHRRSADRLPLDWPMSQKNHLPTPPTRLTRLTRGPIAVLGHHRETLGNLGKPWESAGISGKQRETEGNTALDAALARSGSFTCCVTDSGCALQ